MRSRYETAKKRRDDRRGLALIALSVAGFAGLFGFAYQADSARGLTVSESMASAGIGSAADRAAARCKLTGHSCVAAAMRQALGIGTNADPRLATAEAERRPVVLAESAVSPRFVGYCAGKLLVSAERDAFPAPCAWIQRADSVQLPSGQRVTVY